MIAITMAVVLTATSLFLFGVIRLLLERTPGYV